MRLSILYRGPLASCDYGCWYCPFAKRTDDAQALARDRAALERFVSWVEAQGGHELSILFTPWGEALIRRHCREAMARLSHMPNVRRVAAQTHGAWRPDWVETCDKQKLALWITFHPGETGRERFLGRLLELRRRGVRFSAGAVALKEHFADIRWLRERLSPDVYLWLNAYKREPGYYAEEDLALLEGIDPLFPFNNQAHASLGQTCRCGSSVFSVDGEGTMRRCHFVKAPIGNIYDEAGFERFLKRSPCPNATCGCHIGYVHMDRLGLRETFGEGALERIPARPIWSGAQEEEGFPAASASPASCEGEASGSSGAGHSG